MSHRIARRRFLQSVSWGATAWGLSAASYARVLGANERLRVASVGCGGKGWSDLNGVAASPAVQVTALCDVDESEPFLGRAAVKFPEAKRFRDFRALLTEDKLYDGVIVSTPDHMHAPVALPALQLKKHVFCQKPLTHTIHEARQLRVAAERAGVVTQMGNQIQSHEAYRTAVQWVRDGLIGKVREVFSWQSGAMRWLLADDRPQGADPIPAGLHWYEWLGVAPDRPFKKDLYHSFNWRGWQDFSNGQLGDFGCHILDPVFKALDLTSPKTVTADAPAMNREVWNKWSTVRYTFPGTKFTLGDTLRLTWFDGEGRKPSPEQAGLPPSTKLPGSGSVLVGETGSLIVPHVAMPPLLPEEKFAGRDLPKLPSVDHYVGWADACRGVGKTTSHFTYAGNLTETVLVGTIAVRMPGVTLQWNAESLKFDDPAATARVSKEYRPGWEMNWVE